MRLLLHISNRLRHPAQTLTLALSFFAMFEKIFATQTNELPKECEPFEILIGDPLHAKHIILGENHQKRTSTVACLEALINLRTEKTHLVLLEKEPYGTVVVCGANPEHMLTSSPERRCEGWDNMDAVESLVKQKAILEGYRVALVNIQKKYTGFLNSHLGLSVNHVDQLFLQEIKNIHQQLQRLIAQDSQIVSDKQVNNSKLSAKFAFNAFLENFLQEFTKDHSAVNALERIHIEINKQIPWHYTLFFDPASAQTFSHDVQSAQSLRLRNQFLFQALETTRNETVFLIAGRAHIKPKEMNCHAPQPLDEVACESIERLKESNLDYAVLSM